MQLTCTVTREDVLAFFEYAAGHDPVRQRMLRQGRVFTGVLYSLIIALVFVMVYAFIRGSVPFTLSVGVTVVALVLGLGYGYSVPIDTSGNQLLAYLEQNQDLHIFLGSKTVIVEPEVYQCIADRTTTIVRWEAVRKVIETETHLFVQYATSTACIIPKASALPTEDIPAFIAAAQAAWARAHGSQTKEA